MAWFVPTVAYDNARPFGVRHSTVLYMAREKFWFADQEEKPTEWSTNVHLVEFESPMADFLSWGMRNFNKAIKTP